MAVTTARDFLRKPTTRVQWEFRGQYSHTRGYGNYTILMKLSFWPFADVRDLKTAIDFEPRDQQTHLNENQTLPSVHVELHPLDGSADSTADYCYPEAIS